MGLPDVGVGVLAQVDVGDFALAVENHQLQVAERVRLEGLEPVETGLELVADGIHAVETEKVDVALREDLVERDAEPGRRPAPDRGPQKPGEVRAQIQNLKGVLAQAQCLLGQIGPVDRRRGDGRHRLQLQREDDFELPFRESAELGSDVDEGPVLPGSIDLDPGLHPSAGDLAQRRLLRESRIGDSPGEEPHRAGGGSAPTGSSAASGSTFQESWPERRRYTSMKGR